MRENLGVTNKAEKMRENRSRWFGCMKRRNNGISQKIVKIRVKVNLDGVQVKEEVDGGF